MPTMPFFCGGVRFVVAVALAGSLGLCGKESPAEDTPALAVALSPTGDLVASAVGNRLRLYGIGGGPVAEMVDPGVVDGSVEGGAVRVAHRESISALALDPFGETLASGGSREVKLWRRPRDARAWQGQVGGPTPLMAASPDGRIVATAVGASVRTWDGATGAIGRELSGHADRITAVVFADNGTLVSASADGVIRLTGVGDGALRGVIEAPGPVNAVAVVPGGRLVVAGNDNQLRVFDLPERAPQKLITTVVADRRATMTADRHWMAVAEPTDGRRTRVELLKLDAAGRSDPHGTILLPPLDAPLSAIGLAPGATKETVPQIVVGAADGAMLLVTPGPGGDEGKVERRWRGGAAKVTALAASADGKHLASGLENGQATLWRLSKAEGGGGKGEQALAGVSASAHHPGRRLVAVAGSVDGRPVIRVLRLEGGTVAATIPGHDGGTTALAFSADGGRIVSGGADGIVRLSDWSNAATPLIGRFDAEGPVTAVAVSPDLTLVLAARADYLLRSWSVADGVVGKDLAGHSAQVLAVGFLAGNQPWSVGADRGVKFWHLPDARQAASWELQSPPTALGLSADGATLVAAGDDKLVRTHVLATGQVQQTFTGHGRSIGAVGLSADGKRLVSLERDADREVVVLWDVPTGRLVERVEGETTAALAILLDGTAQACASVRGDGAIAPVDLRFVRQLEGSAQSVNGVAFLDQGRQVIAASADGAVRGYGVESGEGLFTVGHGVPIRALAVTDDESFATGAIDGSLRLWQAKGGAFGIHGIGNLGGEVTALAWSDDRQRIIAAVAGARPAVLVHDTTTGALLERLTNHVLPIAHLAFLGGTPERGPGWIVTTAADGGWRWPLTAGRSTPGLNQNPVHGGAVTAVAAFPGDGGEVVTGCADGIARRIRVADGAIVATYSHGGPVAGVAVSPDGTRVATVGENAVARLWQPGGEQVAELRGDQRLLAALPFLSRQVAIATERALHTKQLSEAADKAMPMIQEAVVKCGAAVAAATGELQQKTAAANQANDAKATAERETNAASAAFRALLLPKAKADQAVKESAIELSVAEQRVAQRQAMADTKPDEPLLKQLLAEAVAALAPAQQKQEAAKAAAQSAAQAATTAAMGATAAATKLTESQKAAIAATAASKQAEEARRGAVDVEIAARKDLERAQAAAQQAREIDQRAAAAVNEMKGRLDAATGAAKGAERPIRRATFSADSTRLLTVGDFPAAHLWDAATGAAIDSQASGQGGLVAGAFLSGSKLVTLTGDGALVAWETNPPWKLVATIGGDSKPGLIADRVLCLDFSADGTHLLVGGGVPAERGEVTIFQVADGARLFHLPEAHRDVVHAARFAPDGRRIASAGADRIVQAFDVASAKPLARFVGHQGGVLGVAWKSDGLEIASAGSDGGLFLWDADTGSRKRALEGFTKPVTAVDFRGATDEILSASADGVVRLHKGTDGSLVRTLPPVASALQALDVAAGGDVIAAGAADGAVHVWDATTGTEIETIPAPK
jgi:WD40 repeat protein